MKTWMQRISTWALLVSMVAGAGGRGGRPEKRELSEAEEEARNALRAAVEEFRQRDDALCREIVALHDKVQTALDEMAVLSLAGRGNSKKALKAQRDFVALEADTKRDRRRLENQAKKHLLPYRKVYDANRSRYDTTVAKANYYARKGEKTTALVYQEKAATFEQKMAPAQHEIDTVEWFLSFDPRSGAKGNPQLQPTRNDPRSR